MGGSTGKDIANNQIVKTAKSIASAGLGVSTVGVVDLDKGKINTNLKDIGANALSSATGGKILNSFMPAPPGLPTAQDPAAQAAAAEKAAQEALAGQVGQNGKGLASTVLGGSTGNNNVLMKKRLLGE